MITPLVNWFKQLIDNFKFPVITITCKNCEERFTYSYTNFRKEDTTCPHCGHIFKELLERAKEIKNEHNLRFKDVYFLLTAMATALITLFPLVFLHELGHAIPIYLQGGDCRIIITPFVAGIITSDEYVTIQSVSGGVIMSFGVGLLFIGLGLFFKQYKRLVLVATGCISIVHMSWYLILDSLAPYRLSNLGDFAYIANYYGLPISMFLPVGIFTLILSLLMCGFLIERGFE